MYTLFHESITAKAEHHDGQDDSSGQGVDLLLGGGDVLLQAGHRVQASHRGGQQVVSGLQLVRCHSSMLSLLVTKWNTENKYSSMNYGLLRDISFLSLFNINLFFLHSLTLPLQ